MLGRAEYTALDLERDGAIDWTTDRISRTTREVALLDGYHVIQTRTFVWDAEGSAISNLVSETRVSTNGLRSWRMAHGLTTASVTVYGGSGYRYVTNTAPDGTKTTETFYNGRLTQQEVRHDIVGVLKGTTFGYDAQGRQTIVVDARNGTNTLAFNDADLVTSSTSPSPGPGQSVQTTTTYYDALQRVLRTVLPTAPASPMNILTLDCSRKLMEPDPTR